MPEKSEHLGGPGEHTESVEKIKKSYDFVDNFIDKRFTDGEIKDKYKQSNEFSDIVQNIEKEFGENGIKLAKLFLTDNEFSFQDNKGVIHELIKQINQEGLLDALADSISPENNGDIREYLIQKFAVLKDQADLKNGIQNIDQEAKDTQEEKEKAQQETKQLLTNLEKNLKHFQEKYKNEFESKNFEGRKTELITKLKQSGIEEKFKGKSVSIEEYATYSVSSEIMGEIKSEGKLDADDDEMYSQFVGDFDRIGNILGENRSFDNMTSDNSIFYTDEVLSDFVKGGLEEKIKPNTDGIDPKDIEKLGKGEKGENFLEQLYSVNLRKCSMIRMFRFLGADLGLGDISVDRFKSIDIKSGKIEMVTSMNGIKSGLNILGDGTIEQTDFLSLESGSFQPKNKSIDNIFKENQKIVTIGLLNYIEQGNHLDVSDLGLSDMPESTSDEQIVKNQGIIQDRFEKKYDEICDKLEAQYSNTQNKQLINSRLIKQDLDTFGVEIIPPPGENADYRYDNPNAKIPKDDKDKFEYLSRFSNTVNFQTQSENTRFKNCLQSLKEKSNESNIQGNVNGELLSKLKSNKFGSSGKPEFYEFFDEFVTQKAETDVFDLDKLEEFSICVSENNSFEDKKTTEEKMREEELGPLKEVLGLG